MSTATATRRNPAMASIPLIAVPEELWRHDLERRGPCSRKFDDVTGQTFGTFTVVGLAGFLNKYSTWLLKCECGYQKLVRHNTLTHPRRCHTPGKCIRCTLATRPTRGMSGRAGFVRWCRLRDRGLLCDEWANDCARFLGAIGEIRSRGWQVAPVDASQPIGPTNWVWQRRRGRPITANGVTRSMSEWAGIVGLSKARIKQRLDRCIRLGLDPSLAVTTPAGCVVGEKQIPVKKAATAAAPAPDSADPREGARLQLADGKPHAIAESRMVALFGRSYRQKSRKWCEARGLKARIRTLDARVLFQAQPIQSA